MKKDKPLKLNYSQRYYQRHKEAIRSYQRLKDAKVKLKCSALIDETNKCERCGFSDRRALIIHHKTYCLKANGKRRYGKLGRIDAANGLVEYSILCRNCHAILHYETGKGSDEKSGIVYTEKIYSIG